LLGQPASPGDAQGVEAVVAEDAEQPAGEPGQCDERVGQRRHRGLANAGRVEPDHLDRRIELVDEGFEQIEAGTDPVAQQQRRPARVGSRPDGDPQPAPADRQHSDGTHQLSST
jgi:hypothetical protein